MTEAAPRSGRLSADDWAREALEQIAEAGVASVLFDRPQARNAMTWGMYEQLAAINRQLSADRSVRVAVFRGAGGQAFVAGTDIEQFTTFSSGEDGVAYERQIEAGRHILFIGHRGHPEARRRRRVGAQAD